MRTTTTLESVINSVHEQSANHYDEIIPVRDMTFESLVRMNIAGQSFGVLRNDVSCDQRFYTCGPGA